MERTEQMKVTLGEIEGRIVCSNSCTKPPVITAEFVTIEYPNLLPKIIISL